MKIAADEMFDMDQAGLEAAENFWLAKHADGQDYKFARLKSGKLVAIAPNSELYNVAGTYKTPREAEQATVGNQPTRTIGGAILGSVLAPQAQYHVVNPSARDAAGREYPSGRAGDPVRAEQSSMAADVAHDVLGDVAHYGPSMAVSLNRNIRNLPTKVLGPGATAVSLLGDAINTAVNAQRGDQLYSSTPENALLTGGAVGAGALLQKYFSKPEQVKRELDAIIRRKMGLGSKGKVDKQTRDIIMQRGEAGRPMYTFKEWAKQPLTNFDLKYDGGKLPMEYVPHPYVRDLKGNVIPRTPNARGQISKDVVRQWLNQVGIKESDVNMDNMQRVLQDTWTDKYSNLGMSMFPTKESPEMNKQQWTRFKHEAKTPEEGLMWDRSVRLVDPRLRAEHELAKAASGQRRAKIPVSEKTEGNQGKGKTTDTEIVTQDDFEKLGKTGKWTRRFGKLGAFLLPMAAEAFGKYLLPTGDKR